MKLAMNNNEKEQSKYFDVLNNYQSYLRFFYALFSIPLSLVYCLASVFFFVIGLILTPLWIGIPILNMHFRFLQFLTINEEHLIEHYAGIQLPKVSKAYDLYPSAVKTLVGHLKDQRNWKRMFYFMVRPFYLIMYVLPAFLFLALLSMMVYMPIRSVFGHIDFFGYYTTDSFIEVVFFYFVSGNLLIGLLHLNNLSIKASCYLSKQFLSR